MQGGLGLVVADDVPSRFGAMLHSPDVAVGAMSVPGEDGADHQAERGDRQESG